MTRGGGRRPVPGSGKPSTASARRSPVRSAQFFFKTTPEELTGLWDAYLDVWSDLAPAEILSRSAVLACQVGQVAKAAAWQRALRDAALPVDDDLRTAVAYYLAEIPKPTPVS